MRPSVALSVNPWPTTAEEASLMGSSVGSHVTAGGAVLWRGDGAAAAESAVENEKNLFRCISSGGHTIALPQTTTPGFDNISDSRAR